MTIEEILELTRAGYTKSEIDKLMSANAINPAPTEEERKPEEGGTGSDEGKPEITPNQGMDELRKQLEAATQKIAEQSIQMEELKKSFTPNAGAVEKVEETTALDAVKAIFRQNL